MHSFYFLELLVDPGGSRKNDAYFFGTLEEVKVALERDLLEDPYHMLIYGEYISLSAYYEGREIWQRDLHPYIVLHVPGYPPLTCTEEGVIDWEDFSDSTGSTEIKVKGEGSVRIGRSAIELLKLEREGLQQGNALIYLQELADLIHSTEANDEGSVEIGWDTMELLKWELKLAQQGEEPAYLQELIDIICSAEVKGEDSAEAGWDAIELLKWELKRLQQTKRGNRLEKLNDVLSDAERADVCSVEIDWDAMEIPKLEGKLVRQGEKVIYLDEYSKDLQYVEESDYGYNNWWG